MRQALAQQHATQVAANQAELTKRIEAEAQKRVEELVKAGKGTKLVRKPPVTRVPMANPLTTTQRHGDQREAGHRELETERRSLNPTEKAQAERERDDLREALEILEENFGSGTRPYDSEDGTRYSRVKTRVLRRRGHNLRNSTKRWT